VGHDWRVLARRTQLLADHHNLTAIAAPTAWDDDTDRYTIGSVWIDTATDTFYICVDATTGAAVWLICEGISNNYVAIIDPVIWDDVDAGYSVGSVWANTTTDDVFVCADNTNGAAVWRNSAGDDIDDAVTKRHTQGTDQKLDDGGVSEVTAAQVKSAVGLKHTQGTDQKLDDGGTNEIMVEEVAGNLSIPTEFSIPVGHTRKIDVASGEYVTFEGTYNIAGSLIIMGW